MDQHLGLKPPLVAMAGSGAYHTHARGYGAAAGANALLPSRRSSALEARAASRRDRERRRHAQEGIRRKPKPKYGKLAREGGGAGGAEAPKAARRPVERPSAARVSTTQLPPLVSSLVRHAMRQRGGAAGDA